MECAHRDCNDGKILFEQACKYDDMTSAVEKYAFPCSVCGLLHVLRGEETNKKPVPVVYGSGEGAYLSDGKVIKKMITFSGK